MPLWAWILTIWIAAIIVFCWFWYRLKTLDRWEDDYDGRNRYTDK